MFACIGHWYMSGLYLVPVAGLIGFLKVSSWRQRRTDTRGTAPVSPTR
jgi:hypothetical protein